MHKITAISAVAISGLLAACFDPSRQEGLACSDDGLCPDGLSCAADQVCRLPEDLIDSGQASDALNGVDASVPDAAAACLFIDTSICAAGAQPAIFIPMGASELNTDTDERCQSFTVPGGQEMCLVYTERFEIDVAGSLRVTGGRPLFVASRSTITISGRMDGSSSRLDDLLGPGGNDPDCALLSQGEPDSDGGGGGAGGSFQGKGGDGGRGENLFGPGGAGATAFLLADGIPDMIHGGCPGSDGGRGGGASQPAESGAGGGGMAFVAAEAFTLSPTGALTANGSGALGGVGRRGAGGGGGSGGMIKIEAPLVEIEGLLLAEGGGGGGGANMSENGNAGLDPSDTNSGRGGQGAGLGNQGNGGEGSTIDSRGLHSGVEGIIGRAGQQGGGGGGGGGAGYLIVKAENSEISASTSSPEITIQNSGP